MKLVRAGVSLNQASAPCAKWAMQRPRQMSISWESKNKPCLKAYKERVFNLLVVGGWLEPQPVIKQLKGYAETGKEIGLVSTANADLFSEEDFF